MRRIWRIEALPWLILLLPLAVLFGIPLLQGRVLLWGLPSLQFIPWRELAWQQLQQGQFPLWNPLNGMGAPLYANYQLALMYPPGWVLFLFSALGTPWLAWGFTLLTAIHLFWAGLGMAKLVQRMGMDVLAQTLASLSFGLGSYFVARSGFTSIIWAGCWLPWIVYYASDIASPKPEAGGKIRVRLILAIAMQLLAGHAQLAWYSLLLAGVWVTSGGFLTGRWRGLWRAGYKLAMAVVLAAGIAAIQLFPTAEYLMQSQRSGAVDAITGLTYSYWPWRILTLFAPNLFGNPANGDFWGYASFWEDAAYIGLLPMMLALTTIGMAIPRRKQVLDSQRILARIMWGIVLIGLLFALGKNTPVFSWFFENVPTFGLFNGPARWMVWVVFGLSLLGAIGAERLIPFTGKRLKRMRQLTAAAVAVTLGAVGGFWVLSGNTLSFARSAVWMGVLGIAAVVLLQKMPLEAKIEGRQRWIGLAGLLVVVDLTIAGWGLIPTVGAEIYSTRGTVPNKSNGERIYLSQTDEYLLKFKRFFRFDDFAALEDWTQLNETMLPNLNLLQGVASSSNFDPFVPGRYSRWMKLLDEMPTELVPGWLGLMNVGNWEKRTPESASGVSWQPVQAKGQIYWSGCAVWEKDGEGALKEVEAMVSEKKVGQVVLEGKENSVECIGGNNAVLRIVTDESQRMMVEVEAEQTGWLVQADTWYPGWEARVDGLETELFRANYLFRAVAVTAGKHQIEIVYRSRSVSIGAIISGLTLLIMVGWLGISKRKRFNVN